MLRLLSLGPGRFSVRRHKLRSEIAKEGNPSSAINLRRPNTKAGTLWQLTIAIYFDWIGEVFAVDRPGTIHHGCQSLACSCLEELLGGRPRADIIIDISGVCMIDDRVRRPCLATSSRPSSGPGGNKSSISAASGKAIV